MRTGISPVVAIALLSLLAQAAPSPEPQRNRGGNRGNRGGGGGGNGGATAQEQAAQRPQGVTTAADGSTILDMTADVNGLPLRFKVSGPAQAFVANSPVNTANPIEGAAAAPNTPGTMGVNVLLHGDGGQSFFDFPNQGVSAQGNLAGVAVLAPNENLFWGGGGGLQRTDGVAHAAAVADLVTQMLPQVMSFNTSDVWFTGVSGGSLMLSGFMMPAHMEKFGNNTGVLLNCAAMEPQVPVTPASAAALATTRVHYQTTQNELAMLQPSIPRAVTAYEEVVQAQGLSADQINALQTVDGTPNGDHCAFDGQGFVSGVQLMAENYAAVMQPGGSGQVPGIGSVKTGVVGNENIQFSGTGRKRDVVG
ncbi:hypothetical protein B0T11DRAFT_299558 [Plectosphaerella cucumerina]|uniref:Cyclin-like f-box protein n=1 Tax=Plectosphaerella cucumerina TaxID=40658 RepID=A0A8K0TDC9_9PEZI|nr:hypothetical protein B0T11DRAFT_299558 [Plectosphaerella cucumerina]